MIAKLTGRIDFIGEDHAVIDVNGVGYLVFASARTLRNLAVGLDTSFAIETHVREDHIHLYGFSDHAEKQWFGLLTTVQGVGAKVALALLSALTAGEIATAIAAQDVTALCRAKGVGKRVGERIVGELKDKAATLAIAPIVAQPLPEASGTKKGAATPAGPSKTSEESDAAGAVGDAVSALTNLGYGRSEAFAAVGRAATAEPGAGLDVLIRIALKELSG